MMIKLSEPDTPPGEDALPTLPEGEAVDVVVAPDRIPPEQAAALNEVARIESARRKQLLDDVATSTGLKFKSKRQEVTHNFLKSVADKLQKKEEPAAESPTPNPLEEQS